jgi:hypothetical protein
MKLDQLSRFLGLAGKPDGVDGSKVEAMIAEGEISDVARYCETDVVNTYRLWLIYDKMSPRKKRRNPAVTQDSSGRGAPVVPRSPSSMGERCQPV